MSCFSNVFVILMDKDLNMFTCTEGRATTLFNENSHISLEALVENCKSGITHILIKADFQSSM